MLRDSYYYHYYGREWTVRVAAVATFALAVAGVVWFGLLAGGRGDGQREQVVSASPPSQPVVTARSTPGPSTSGPSTSGSSTTTIAGPQPSTTTTTTPTTATTLPRTTSGPSSSVTTSSEVPPPTAAGYPTLPDGSPVPVLAMYDGELITLSGAVPSEAAAERLRVLALANSTVPGAEVASFLTIEPTVPVGVGVRVIEVNSPRFPEGSPTVSLEHAAQLDRVVAVMTALPNVTVEVIGHADQRGASEANFVLSAERARSAADYVASNDIDPARLSSRGAGESDLLTLNNDEAALALNRRTEFVFYGLLVDAPEQA